ncbi:SpoIIE family protein phosphatase [Streptomyces sp. NPDC058464]|uniref:SpoIIE family protein phosphatase n=1 Tax=Streptomyces sp. NPDC058464 TaxID=3346511 RepID=UPI00365EFD5A
MRGSDEPIDHLIRRLAAAPAESGVGAGLTDQRGRVTHWSGEAEALLGYPPAEITGRPVSDLVGPQDVLRHRDGRALAFRLRLSPLVDATGVPAFLMTCVPGLATDEESDTDGLGRALFQQHPIGQVIYDCDGRVMHVNRALLERSGLTEEQVRGLRVSDFLPGPTFELGVQRILKVAETGEAQFGESFVRLPGEEKAHAWAVDYFPLVDATGRVRAVGQSIQDYSKQYESRLRLALLTDAGTRIGNSLDIAGTARELAAVVVPRFASLVSVAVLPPVLKGGLPRPVLSSTPVELFQAAFRSAFAIPPEDASPPSGTWTLPLFSPLAKCLAEDRTLLLNASDALFARWLAEDPVHGARAREQGAHSLIAVPIPARGTPLGLVVFVRCSGYPEAFDTDDLAVAEDVVARAAICLDNARRFARERDIALRLQRNLLLQSPEQHAAVRTAARYIPAGAETEAGGDWFDVIPLPGARVGLVVGDVVGHGVNASATMGRLRTAVRVLADIDLPPDELLTHLDDLVSFASHSASGDEDTEIPGDIGATCLYAVYDPVSGTCSLARAGHPAPVLVRPDGSSTVVDMPLGPPLGLGSLPFEVTEMALPEGSLLALFTDGLLDRRGQDIDEQVQTLCRTLAEPAASLDELCDRTVRRLEPARRTDDAVLLLARPRVLNDDCLAVWDLRSDPSVVADVRRLATERVTAWGLDEASFVTELVVSELVTNAIRYGTGPIRLRLIKDATLICEVSDGSSTSPHLRRARDFDEGGRGLLLVAQLTHRWGTRHTRVGKTIWAEQLLGSG